ncbi:MAG: hypothetical protein QM530_10905 [Phycisphaerales bacterium]|nr:hypothetical protein [Phycisphaerales bacterium]
MSINRSFFFNRVKTHLLGGKLLQSRADGLSAILDEWESKYANQDDRFLAYMLATAHHETDSQIKPIEEYGKGKGRSYGNKI